MNDEEHKDLALRQMARHVTTYHGRSRYAVRSPRWGWRRERRLGRVVAAAGLAGVAGVLVMWLLGGMR